MARAPETPAVPQELLKRLEDSFPDKLPEGYPDLREIDRRVGHQEVIRLLRRWRDQSAKP